MTESDPYPGSYRYLVTARLSLRPSDALKEVVEPFYKPSIAGQRLSRLALRSSIGVPLEVLSGQRYVYNDPQHIGRNAIQDYEQYKRSHVRPVVGHQLPLLSHLGVLRNKQGALRLQFRFGLRPTDAGHLSRLHEFRDLAITPVLGAQLDLAPSDVIANEVMLRDAVHSLRSVLGVDHPAHHGLPEQKRYVGDSYHADITSEQLSFRIGER